MLRTTIGTILLVFAISAIVIGIHYENYVISVIGGAMAGMYNAIVNNK